MYDYGFDMDEVMRVIDTAEVLVVRFAILDKRLLIDARTSAEEGPLISVVPRATSLEDRFRSLKQMRPRFPLPDKIMSFLWPRHLETFRSSVLWERIVQRLVSLGGEEMAAQCEKVCQGLEHDERAEVLAAIRGGEGYQSLWERSG
jgi:hypothetical protein